MLVRDSRPDVLRAACQQQPAGVHGAGQQALCLGHAQCFLLQAAALQRHALVCAGYFNGSGGEESLLATHMPARAYLRHMFFMRTTRAPPAALVSTSHNHALAGDQQRTSGDPSAANHICQSRRGWCGATQGTGRAGSPGLYLAQKCPLMARVRSEQVLI